MTPRLEGVDTDHLAWMLTALDERIDSTPDETDYLLNRDFQARAQLRFAAGFAADDIAHDLLWAARCLRFKEDLHLLKVPVERFRSRRIDPLELAAASGDALLAQQIAERYAMPLTTVVAGMADEATMSEARTVTRCFDRPAKDALDLAGLAAICWSAGLAASIRGFEDEAAMASRAVAKARADAPPAVEEEAPKDGPLGRYLLLFGLLKALHTGDAKTLVAGAGDLAAGQLERVRQGMTEAQWAKPSQAPRYLDLASVALCTVFRAVGGVADRADLPEGAAIFADLLCD
jgi:hypothetical protein